MKLLFVMAVIFRDATVKFVKVVHIAPQSVHAVANVHLTTV